MRRIAATALAVAIVVGAAACGGEEVLGETEFTKRAEAACGRAEREFLASTKKVNARQLSGAELQAFAVKALGAAADRQNEALAAIVPPEDVQDKFDDYRDTIAARLDLELERAQAGEGPEGQRAALAATKKMQEAARLARELGLKRCK